MHKKKGPWVVTGTREVYKNPWITVHEDKVIRPDGKPGIFGTVVIKPGVGIIPMDDESNVYLTKEYRYADGEIKLEVSSGGIDDGESKLSAAKRELKEETGFVAKKWTYLGVVDPLSSVICSPQYMYLAEGLAQKEPDPEGSEVIQVIKLPFKKALDMVMKGKITYGGTAVAILKIAELRRQ